MVLLDKQKATLVVNEALHRRNFGCTDVTDQARVESIDARQECSISIVSCYQGIPLINKKLLGLGKVWATRRKTKLLTGAVVITDS